MPLARHVYLLMHEHCVVNLHTSQMLQHLNASAVSHDLLYYTVLYSSQAFLREVQATVGGDGSWLASALDTMDGNVKQPEAISCPVAPGAAAPAKMETVADLQSKLYACKTQGYIVDAVVTLKGDGTGATWRTHGGTCVYI